MRGKKQGIGPHLFHRYSEAKLAKKNMYWLWLEGIPCPVLIHPAESVDGMAGGGGDLLECLSSLNSSSVDPTLHSSG